MTAIPVKVSCPICGALTLPIDQVRLVVSCCPAPHPSRVRFVCPTCTDIVNRDVTTWDVVRLVLNGIQFSCRCGGHDTPPPLDDGDAAQFSRELGRLPEGGVTP